MARKKEQAFRTITEVSNWLKTPSHVLRFWESKFSQIKPVKRAGGRRYYRPEDLKLIGGIKCLLHVKEYSIEPAFPEKDQRKSTKINNLVEKSQLNENLGIIKTEVTSKIILTNIKLHSNLEKNDMIQIENLYFQLQRIRNRMKHRLEAF